MIMNKRGDADNILTSNVIYIVLFAVAFLGLFLYIVSFQDGALLWQDFYAKEIAISIDSLSPTADVNVSMSNVLPIALKHHVPLEKIVTVDNVNHLVEVRLTSDSVSRFPFFADVEIHNPQMSEGTFHFTISNREVLHG